MLQVASFFLEIRGMIKRASICIQPLASNTHMAQHKIAITIAIDAAVQDSVVAKFKYLRQFVIFLEKGRASNAKRGSDSIGTGGIPLQDR